MDSGILERKGIASDGAHRTAETGFTSHYSSGGSLHYVLAGTIRQSSSIRLEQGGPFCYLPAPAAP